MATIIQRIGSFYSMVEQETKIEQGMQDREKYLEAKGKYDRLLKHIEDFKQGKVTAQPLLTCIMRTQGQRREALEEILLCLSSQTCHNFEFILIPHKAGEEKLNQIKEMVSELPKWLQDNTRVCPLNEGNRTTPLNYGFSIAKGLYAAIIDDDDLIMEDYVETFINGIKENYGTILHAYTVPQDWTIVKDKNNENNLRAIAEPLDIYCREFSIENEMTMNFCPLMGQCFPLYAFRELDIKFDETLDTTEDWDYLMRCAAICGVVDLKHVVAIYRLWKGAENSHTEHSKKVWDDNYKLLVKRFSEMPIIYPFKKADENRFPIGVEIFYSNKKGHFTQKNHILPRFDHENGLTKVSLNSLEKLGPVISFRFDPDNNGNRVVNNFNLKITLDDDSILSLEKANKYTNGVEHAKDSYTFLDDDPQICYNFEKAVVIKSVEIQYFIDQFIKDKPYKPKKVRFPLVKRAKSKIKKILRWIKSRL